MHIHATINERTLRRSFREQKFGRNGLTVIDRDLPAFGLKVTKDRTKTFFVRVSRKPGAENVVLDSAEEITAGEAREKARATIETARTECETGALFANFVQEFMRRQRRRWKPSAREGNARLIDRYLIPFFGKMRVAEISRVDIQRWFDSLSGTPANANRTLPVLSVMVRQAELRDLGLRVPTPAATCGAT